MNLTIRGHQVEVTSALREYVLTKLKPVTSHFDQVVDVSVRLTGCQKNGGRNQRGCNQKAAATIIVRGRTIYAEQAHEGLYAAVDKLMNKLDRKVVAYKTQVQRAHPGGCPKRRTGQFAQSN